MAETLLYTLEIKGTDAELLKLEQINTNLTELKESLKQQAKDDKIAAEQTKITIKEQQKNYRDLQKSIENRNKAEQKSADTLQSLRAQLSLYNKELSKIPLGTKQWKEQADKINQVKGRIKEADESVGRFQGNVGNYKNDIISAFQQMGINVNGLTRSIGAANSAIQLTNVAVGGTSKALRILKVALVSTGIGAIVVVLGSIIAYLSTTQKGIDAINSVLKPLGQSLQRVLGIAQNLGSAFVKIFSGKGKEGWEDLKTTISGVGDELSDAWKDGQRLAEITKEIEQARIKLAENEARINNEMAEQRQILDDVNKSDAERRAAGEKFKALQEELTGYQREIAKLAFEEAKIKAKQNDTDREAQAELARLKNEVYQIDADATNKQTEVQNKLNAIQKKRIDEQRKAAEELRKQQQQEFDSAVANIQAILNEKLKLKEEGNDVVFKLFDEEEIDDLPDVVATLGELQQSELEAARATTSGLANEYNLRLEALKKFLADGLITEEQYTLRRRQLQMELTDASIAALKNVAVEGSKIQKGLFLFEKVLAIRKAFFAITQGTAETAKVGFPQNIPLLIGFAAQVAGLISAISSVSAPEPPKFARGVIGLQGAGSETSDSIDAKLSKGESVITARATKAFAPILAEMEMAVGNKPNFQLNGKRFAGGIINAAGIEPRTDFTGAFTKVIDQVVRSVGSIPVVVAEGDITATQSRVRRIKVSGDL